MDGLAIDGGPYALTTGPDGALWVTLVHAGEVARVGMDGREDGPARSAGVQTGSDWTSRASPARTSF